MKTANKYKDGLPATATTSCPVQGAVGRTEYGYLEDRSMALASMPTAEEVLHQRNEWYLPEETPLKSNLRSISCFLTQVHERPTPFHGSSKALAHSILT